MMVQGIKCLSLDALSLGRALAGVWGDNNLLLRSHLRNKYLISGRRRLGARCKLPARIKINDGIDSLSSHTCCLTVFFEFSLLASRGF